jgi:hypothetical protein
MKRQRVREVIKTHFRKIKIETGAIELSKIKKSLLCMPCRGCRLSVVSSRIQVANIAAFFIKGLFFSFFQNIIIYGGGFIS